MQQILSAINRGGHTAGLELSAAVNLSKEKLKSSDGTKSAVAKEPRANLPPEGRKKISVKRRQYLSTEKDQNTFSAVSKVSEHFTASIPG